VKGIKVGDRQVARRFTMKITRLQVLNLIASTGIGIIGIVLVVRMLMAGEGRDASIWIFVALAVISLATTLKLGVSMIRVRIHRIQLERQQQADARNKGLPSKTPQTMDRAQSRNGVSVSRRSQMPH
jgi:hypothetical protein